MAVHSPDQMTAAFEAAYNARDKDAVMALYAPEAAHTFDGVTTVRGLAAISAAFDRGFAGPNRLSGEVVTSIVAADTALLRVQWSSLDAAGVVRGAFISCEVLAKGADGLWRYVIDDATGGNRPTRD